MIHYLSITYTVGKLYVWKIMQQKKAPLLNNSVMGLYRNIVFYTIVGTF